MKTTAEILRGLPYFSDLPDELLESVCDASEQLDVDTGVEIITEGTHSEEMYVVVEGEMVVTKNSAGKVVELGRIGPGNVVGEIALLDDAPRTATVSSTKPSHVIRIPVSAFETLLSDARVTRRMFRTVTSRLRGIEDTLRHEERMAALGRMAAQLMHELNNPAAAVARTSSELERVYEELSSHAAAIAGMSGGIEPPPAQEMSALDRGDAEDSMADWLGSIGLSDAWDLAPSLVEIGWTVEALAEATKDIEDAGKAELVRFVGLTSAAELLIQELGIGARRISELVRVVKDYSFLDQAPVQEIDPTSGIRDTLVLLKPKLRNVDVTLDFAHDIAKVEAPGRDLNQVWTNLIDNAADAMPDGGTLRIAAQNVEGGVRIEISDSGHGMPPDVAERVFDPFFTTKEPGKGTGLGLHTVHTIIGRARGEISVESSSEGTKFKVFLPASGGPGAESAARPSEAQANSA